MSRPAFEAARRSSLARLAILAALAARPGLSRADAYEASIHIQAIGGIARLGDPFDGDVSAPTVRFGGGAARFTWATRDWLAWEIEAYGLATGSARRTVPGPADAPVTATRGAAALGLDAGLCLRLGVRIIPTFSLAVGPQLRLYPSAIRSEGGTALAEPAPAARAFDISARAAIGLDVRINRRWIAGIRADARAAAGLGDGRWQSVQGLVHVSYNWYPRWWLL